jgi:hypothetical protein
LSLTECRDVRVIATTFRNTPVSMLTRARMGAEALFVKTFADFDKT